MNSGFILKLFALALILLLTALPAFAADIVVVEGGTCSFYNAWLSARYNEDRGGCTHTGDWDDNNWSNPGDAGGDTIILRQDVRGGNLQMFGSRAGVERSTGNITIEGGGHTYTMTANNGRHFHIAGRHLTINNLVLTRADNTNKAGAGGAILLSGAANTDAELTVNDSVFHGNKSHDEGGVIMINDNTSATIRRSVFYNNESSNDWGSAIAFGRDANVTVDSSSFYNNNGKGVIAAKPNAVAENIILKHVTIVNNRGSRGGISFRLNERASAKFELSNSIDWNNAGGACQLGWSSPPPDTTLRNNILGSGSTQNCKDGANTLVGDPMLTDSAGVTTLVHLVPLPGSPAIDAVSAADCEAVVGTDISRDPLGTARPQNGKCEIGAYEVKAPPGPETDGGSKSVETAMAAEAAAKAVSTCLTLDGIQVTGLSESTQCQRVDAVGIANPNIQEGDFVDAVDVWSWVLPNTQICFEAAGGVIKFIDTAAMPRTVQDLTAYSLNGMTCATINGPGILVLLPGDPPPARNAASGSAPTATTGQSLSGCMVRATASLNLRASPGGAVIGGVGESWLLTAVERTAGWFRVDRLGEYGWISADYVETEGTCG